MAKERIIPCIHYLCETECALGHEGTFKRKCQKCKDYVKRKGDPNKKDLKKEKLQKYMEKVENFF